MNFKAYKHLTLTFLFILPVSLGGCTPKNAPFFGRFFGKENKVEKKNVTINVWGLWETEATMQPIFEKYMKENPNVKVNYEERSILPLVDYKERVFTRAFEGVKPDVVLVHVSWLPRLISQGGVWEAPKNLFSADFVKSNFFPVVSEYGTSKGELYSLPSTYDGLVLIYNKKHFEEAGLSEPPLEWEQFRRYAVKLTVKDYSKDGRGTSLRAGAAIGTADNIDHFSDILGLMFLQAGVKIPDKLDDKYAADALTFYTNFAKEDMVWDNSFPESVRAFAEGKVSMIFAPTWRLYELLNNMSDYSVIGVAPLPQVDLNAPVTWASYWTWVVLKSSPNPAESWDVVRFLVDEAQQTTLFSETSKIRQFGSIHSNVKLAQDLASNAFLKPAIEGAPYAKTAEIAARSGNRRQYEALKQAVNEVLSGTPSSQALAKAKETIAK